MGIYTVHVYEAGVFVVSGDDAEPVVSSSVAGGSDAAGRPYPSTQFLFPSFDAGAPDRAVLALAGHKNLSTPQRYMHLSPAAVLRRVPALDG